MRWTLFAQAQLETLVLLRQAHARLLSEYDSAKEEVRVMRGRAEQAEAEALVGGVALHTRLHAVVAAVCGLCACAAQEGGRKPRGC